MRNLVGPIEVTDKLTATSDSPEWKLFWFTLNVSITWNKYLLGLICLVLTSLLFPPSPSAVYNSTEVREVTLCPGSWPAAGAWLSRESESCQTVQQGGQQPAWTLRQHWNVQRERHFSNGSLKSKIFKYLQEQFVWARNVTIFHS